VTRALFDAGLLGFAEPFSRFRNNGLLIKDGAKISKSRGNVVNPDEYLDTVGADTLRCYLMFLGPFSEGGDWRDDGIKGLSRFLSRVWQTVPKATSTGSDKDRERMRHRVIKGVTEDIPELRYNTALAKLMQFSHQLEGDDARKVDAETMVQLLAPFAPHLAEELWEGLGNQESVFDSTWPEFDPELAKASRVTIAVQVNGKTRATFDVDAGTAEDELEKLALEQPKIREMLNGNRPQKVVAVVDKIVSLVV
jgi:leucyl-tRNA synthetase